MLTTRLWMGAVLVVLLALGLWLDEHTKPTLPGWLPPYPCWLVFSLVVLVGCCREMRQLLRRRGIRPSRIVSYGSVIGIGLANWIPCLTPSTEVTDRLAWPFAAVCVANMVVLTREAFVFRQPGEAVATAGAATLLIFYLGVLGTMLIQLRGLDHGWVALATQVAVAKFGDSGAYFGGRAFGRHKLCPWLSPNKTVEGAVAGVVASIVGAALMMLIASRTIGTPCLGWGETVLFAVSVGPLAQLGDLIESLIKRDCQQKDASDLVPGFGGILDVLDSLLFSAPLALALWIWLGPGWGMGFQNG